MTEPRDNSDDGPDFSFLRNDQVNKGDGEVDFAGLPQSGADSETDGPTEPAAVSPTTSLEEISDQAAGEIDEPVEVSSQQTDVDSAPQLSASAMSDTVETTDSATSPSEFHVPEDGDSAAAEAADSVDLNVKSVVAAHDEVAAVPEVSVADSVTAADSPAPDADTVVDDAVSGNSRRPPMVPQKTFSIVAGYAGALTLLFLLLWITGRVSLTGPHPLESLPDIAPLQENEFQPVNANASLPRGHTLKLGDSQRFGDVIVTPLRVTTEPITFVHMSSGSVASDRKTQPVLKLWFELKNASDDVAFPPWDIGLMCSRSPAESTDDSTMANSWLLVRHTADTDETRLLNYLHPLQSEYDLVGQHSRQLVQPGQTMTTFIASSPDFAQLATDTVTGYRWRLQLRKGVNRQSENGVTTLIDVEFTQDDVSTSG
ncbi:MAG: hypothetical protein ABGZ53_02515 [Fuerstiella sp.]